jgi:chemotaxis protein MotA
MNPFGIIGLLLALSGVLFVVLSSDVSPAALWDLSSFVLVLGGTLGMTLVSSAPEDLLAALKLYGRAFQRSSARYGELINLFVELAEQARRDGLLSLEERVSQLDAPFIQKGLQLLVDGTDPALVREMLETDIDQLAGRHARRYGVFDTAGGYAPTMGMMGTVIGIVFTLANLSTPEQIGAQIAIAFITTLYGIILANFFFLPIGGRLKKMSATEVSEWELALVGLMSVQAGDNPQVVRQKLEAFLPVNGRGVEVVTEPEA